MNNQVFSTSGASAPSAPRPDSAPKSAFDVPVEAISLPSCGALYPPNHPFHHAEFAEIRCMTAREEDLITSSALIKQGLVLNRLLSACLVNKSVDIDTLLLGDLNALLIGVRAISYGTDFKSVATCPACDHTFDHTFDLGTFPIKRLNAQPVLPGKNEFEFTLPLSKQKVHFKLLTAGDQRMMTQIEERKRKAKLTVENRVTSMLQTQVLSIGGEEDPGKLQTIILNMRANDSRALRAHMLKIAPNIDMTQAIDCPSCGEHSEVNVPIGTGFFWPVID